MVILFNKPNAGPMTLPVSSSFHKGQFQKKLVLLRGNNEVEKEDWAQVRQFKQVQVYLKKGWIVEQGEPKIEVVTLPATKDGEKEKVQAEIKSVKEFKAMAAADAEEIVKNTVNLDTLNKWLKGEKRESVRIALKEQIESVENYNANSEEDKLVRADEE